MTLQPQTFKFQYVNSAGKSTGWRARQGTLSQEYIELHDAQLNYGTILDSISRDQRLILTLNPEQTLPESVSKNLLQGHAIVLHVSNAKPIDLERAIDRISSSHHAETHRQKLIKEGKGEAFRSCICPECSATIDVSLLNKSPYVYCRFCESVFQDNGPIATKGQDYRLCDECGWFDRVQGYTEFYFYFLLVIYGFSYKRRYLCDTCVDRVFWKVLLINFIFVIGIFPAIWMKIKSLTGRHQDFQELAKANALGKKGRAQEALPHYNTLFNRFPDHPGILFSQALGYLKSQDWQGGWDILQQSISSCSNYAPAARMMNQLQDAASQAAEQST